jgi:cell division transport system ATP-binding protein
VCKTQNTKFKTKGITMITFDNVTKTYNTNIGLENASIHINKGDFVFLVGPSGAGKSTFIKLILKEIDADSGSIVVDGQEVTTLSNREIPGLRRKIGIVFQDFRLLPKKTVYENVAFAMEILHRPKRQIRKKVPQVLSLVGISDKADKYPDELSAGEQQRVAIARAIINNPTVLIADEPTGNLDPDTAAEIMDLLNQINITGTTIVMVTHAKDIVDRMQKRVVAIEGGHIVRDEFGQYGFEEESQGFAEEIFEEKSYGYEPADYEFEPFDYKSTAACRQAYEYKVEETEPLLVAEPEIEIFEEASVEEHSEPEAAEPEVSEMESLTLEEFAVSEDNCALPDLADDSEKFKTMRFKTTEYGKLENNQEAESLAEEEGDSDESDSL